MMRFIKVSLLVLFCIVSVVSVLFLSITFPRLHSLKLSFLGYTAGSNGLKIASFCISNHSSRPVVYLADGPSAPHYYLTGLLFHDTNTGVIAVTNYNMWFSLYATELTLPPRRTVTFVVPMTTGITDVTVGVHYLPRHGPLRELAKEVERRLTGDYSGGYQNVELKAPFK